MSDRLLTISLTLDAFSTPLLVPEAEDERETGPEEDRTDEWPQRDGTFVGPPLRNWQRRAFEKWVATGRRGIVEAITGTGKSMLGLVAMHDTVVRGGGKALVVVPTLALVEQWHRAISTVLPTVSVGRVTGGSIGTFLHYDVLVATVHSAHRAPPNPGSLGLLVADEVHRYGSLSYSRVLSARYPRRLGLTGTLERQMDNGVDQYLRPYFGAVTTRYGYAAALRDEVVAPFHLALVGVEFTPWEQSDYRRATDRCTDAMTELIDEFGYPSEWPQFFSQVQACLRKSESWQEERELCSSYLSGFTERRRLLAEAEGKEQFAASIAGSLSTLSGTLIFTETKESARRLAWIVGNAAPAFPLTGDSSAHERAAKLRAFGLGTLAVLTAPRILDEGIDVPEAELAIVVGSSQSARQMIQRMGRVIRLKKDGRLARLMILYVRGTGEDPEREGHLGFLEQVRPFAASERVFDSGSTAPVADWLASR